MSSQESAKPAKSKVKSKKVSAKDFHSVKEYYEARAVQKQGSGREDGGKKPPKLSLKQKAKLRHEQKKKKDEETRKTKDANRQLRAAQRDIEKARISEMIALFEELPQEMPEAPIEVDEKIAFADIVGEVLDQGGLDGPDLTLPRRLSSKNPDLVIQGTADSGYAAPAVMKTADGLEWRPALFEYPDSDTEGSNSKTFSDSPSSSGLDSPDSNTSSIPTSVTGTQNAESADCRKVPALLWGILRPEGSDCNGESVRGAEGYNLPEMQEEESSNETEQLAATNAWGLLEQEESGGKDVSYRYKPTTEEEYYNSRPGPPNMSGTLGGNKSAEVTSGLVVTDSTDVEKIAQVIENEYNEIVDVGGDRGTRADSEPDEKVSEGELTLGSGSEKADKQFSQPDKTLRPEKRNVSGSTDQSGFSNNAKPIFDPTDGDSPASPMSVSVDDESVSSSNEDQESNTGEAKSSLAPNALVDHERPLTPVSVDDTSSQGPAPEEDSDPYASQPDPFSSFLPADLPPSVAQAFKSMITHFNGRVSYLEEQNVFYQDRCRDLTYANRKLSSDYATLAASVTSTNENSIHSLTYLSQQNLQQQHLVETLIAENAEIKAKIHLQDAHIWQLQNMARDGENELRVAKSGAQTATKKAEACEKKIVAKDALIKGLMDDVDMLGQRQDINEKRVRGMELKNYQKVQDDDVEELGLGRYAV